MAASVTFWMPPLILSADASSFSESSFSAAMASSMASTVVGSTLSLVLFQRLFGRVDQAFCLVARFDKLFTFFIGFGVGFSVLHHCIDVVV